MKKAAPPKTSPRGPLDKKRAAKLAKEADAHDPAAVDAYLDAVPQPLRGSLQAVREAIRKAAPQATERISYKIPIFEHGGHLCAIAAFKAHGSLVVMNAALVDDVADELARRGLIRNGTTIRFTPERPIPAAMVKRLVKARLAENTARAA